MLGEQQIGEKLADLQDLAPAGFAIALHIQFTTPTYLFQTYPKAWIEVYSSRGLVLRDPTVIWGFDNLGVIDWRELAKDDSEGIMALAREHGLVEGFTCAIEDGESRSIASFSRTDQSFSDEEKSAICDIVNEMHVSTTGLSPLSAETRNRLRRMSIQYSHPGPAN